MKILINYANDKYKKTQKINSWTGLHIGGFDKVFSFGPEDIDTDFYNKNKEILNIERGNGLWLWKPYFINKVMEEANEGDLIFYCDSGAFFYRKIDKVVEVLGSTEKILVTDIPLLESCFTKPECFKIMDCDSDKYKYSNQIIATFFAAISCKETKEFVKKWLEVCCDVRAIMPEVNKKKDINDKRGFVEHREDQSILSLLCKKEGIKAHKDFSIRGEYPETYFNYNYSFVMPIHDDKYKPILWLHKSPKVTLIGILKGHFNCVLCKFKYIKFKQNSENKLIKG